MKNFEVFKVIKPGMLTSVQDLGRKGYQQYGMAVSGAMDTYALRMANILVGNEEHEAALEMTLIGPVLFVESDCTIAVTGADLSPAVNGQLIPMWTSIHLVAGSILQFGKLNTGCRAYLAVEGGLDVPPIMGSRSTYLRAGIGGHKGRALQTGDKLSRLDILDGQKRKANKLRRRLHANLIPSYSSHIQLRVVLSPQWNDFRKNSHEKFLTSKFQITSQSDRMGYRLLGTPLEVKHDVEQITEPIPFGTIQVPPGGYPIVLLADRQTSGGYPIIATVISVDLPKIAQGKPGDLISFAVVDIEESHELLRGEEKTFRILKAQVL
ncbi:biotin-dependent carboxyltransferase [Bacillus sp. Bva_UNVM-123]|uniref:biotin-dependent carboxyltransferase family protein n=1 Tax=Bacillus sp. Bva_UNVM-123 TaxID=2829798 RepID=UPI00391F10C3